ncbi:MAG TPA: molybdopterin-dependent oxidoreductase, partial [Polyangiaceae bacterium]|nr:molybdopterin-dependent oxidoreductase [Polyangiaceae bacterium]
KRAHLGRVLEARVKGAASTVKKALAEAKSYFEGVPGDGVAIVLSAQHPLEDNWALRELASVYLGTRSFYATGLAEGYADTILIHEDKNPNTRGVLELAPAVKPFSTLLDDIEAGKITHVIALGGETPADDSEDLKSRAEPLLERLRSLVTIAAHDGLLARAAHVLLPASSWAEASGTYVNAKGLHQVSEKALEPQGATAPAWQLVAELGQALGYDTSWGKLKQVRARLTAAPTVPEASAVSSSPEASA